MSTNRLKHILEETPVDDWGSIDTSTTLDDKAVEKCNKFHDEMVVKIEEAAGDGAPSDMLSVCLLNRAIDLAHFIYGNERAKELCFDMMKDAQKRYAIEHN
jgi:hypothetical protein